MNNQNGPVYQNTPTYQGGGYQYGGYQNRTLPQRPASQNKFINSLTPMKIVSILLVLLTIGTFFLSWIQLGPDYMEDYEDMIEEAADDYDIDIDEAMEDYVDELASEIPEELGLSRRKAKDVAERIIDMKLSLADLQVVLGTVGESCGEVKDALDKELEDELEEAEYYYGSYSDYDEYVDELKDYYGEISETIDIVIIVNIVYQILFFAAIAVGAVSLITYLLDKNYNGWGFAIMNVLLFGVSIAAVILGNDYIDKEGGVDDVLGLGFGGFAAVVLAIAACVTWGFHLKNKAAGNTGAKAFGITNRPRPAAAYPGYNAYQQPMNNGYAQQSGYPAYNPYQQQMQQPMNNGYAQQQPTYPGYNTYQQQTNNWTGDAADSTVNLDNNYPYRN